MRAMRFGSYSIAATLAGTPALSRLKSTIADRLLVTAADEAAGDTARAVAAAGLALADDQRLFRRFLCDILARHAVVKRRVGVVGRYVLTGMS